VVRNESPGDLRRQRRRRGGQTFVSRGCALRPAATRVTVIPARLRRPSPGPATQLARALDRGLGVPGRAFFRHEEDDRLTGAEVIAPVRVSATADSMGSSQGVAPAAARSDSE